MHISKRINVYISIVIAVSLYLSSLNEYVRAATIFISSLFLLLLMHKLVLPDIEDIRPKEIFKNFIKNKDKSKKKHKKGESVFYYNSKPIKKRNKIIKKLEKSILSY